MGTRQIHQYKNTNVVIMKGKYRNNTEHERYCYLCKEKLKEGQSFIFPCNNYKFIPNIAMHEQCFANSDPQETFEKIEKDWTEFKKLEKFFG